MIDDSRLAKLLLEVAQASEGIGDEQKPLSGMVESLQDGLGLDWCVLVFKNEASGEFVVSAGTVEGYPQGASLPLDDGINSRLICAEGPLVTKKDDPGDTLKGLGPAIISPICTSKGLKGALIAGVKGVRHLEVLTDILNMVCKTLGAALGYSELRSETKSQIERLRIINDLSRDIASIYDPRELLDVLAERIAVLMQVKKCVIRIVEGDMLRVVSAYGPLDRASVEEAIPVGKGIAGWVAKEGKPIIVDDSGELSSEMNFPPLRSRTAVSIPLSKENRIIGTLGLYDKLDEHGNVLPFAHDDLIIAEGIATVSAIALENTLIREEHERAAEEQERSERRLELLFESVQSGIVSLDREFNVKSANKYIERWTNTPLDEIIGKNAIEVFHSREGICPHCAARTTLEDGEINSITQSVGLNYAELSSYPVLDESGAVSEAIVFIQDITDRVMYQEEIMGLYREVVQNKEYIESFINNSADAIITTDMNGNVISWNPAAESIYGFARDEVLGKPLPNIPEELLSGEIEVREKIRRGDVVTLETFRKRKDGSRIETSLTISPIKDVSGEIIGMSSISRDISERKRVEKELVRRNQELSRLFFISSATRGTLDLNVLIRMILSAVTMGDGLGFNRAILFLYEHEEGVLKSYLGVGPSTQDEANKIWEELSHRDATLHQTLREIENGGHLTESFLDKIGKQITLPIDNVSVLAKVFKSGRAISVSFENGSLPKDDIMVDLLGSRSYAAVPLISRDRVTGVIWVDNKFTYKNISEDDIKFLTGFADQVAFAIENARLFQQVSNAEAELENIFSSISDMVFLTEKDFTIKSVNQAVIDNIGIPRDKIVGEKCYKIFHNTDEPWPLCPHHTTVSRLQPSIEEVYDPNLDGTYITSTAPMFDNEGQFSGTVHVMRNVTEINELKKRLQSSEKMAALGEVAAKVAHEIRNPLVSVGGFARRLERMLDGSGREFAVIIAEEVERLERILKEVLGFAKEVRQQRRETDLNHVVRNVVELMGLEFASSRNSVRLDLVDGGISINLDPDRFREVVMNILSNANLESFGGEIKVRTYMHEGLGVFEVEDSGAGVHKGNIEKIFDPFFTTRPSGTGLGLAVTKRIVEENNGWITVENKPSGDGAVFKVYLPIQEGLNEDTGG